LAVVVGDLVHPVVRDIVVEPDKPIRRGRIAYRAVLDSSRLPKKSRVRASRGGEKIAIL
jgi:6-hydroxynicotinate 3-monooxygenase